MFEQTFKNIDDVLWKEAGCTTELDYTEQTSWILFLKYLDDLEQDRALKAELHGKPYSFIIDPPHRWSSWAAPKNEHGAFDHNKAMTGPDLIAYVDDKLFPYLQGFKSRAERPDTIEYKIGEIFGEIKNKFRSGYSLRDALELVDQLRFGTQAEKHELSHLYEAKIKNMGNAGRNGGEYYTPRPLIRAMIKIIKPQIGERIYDGACGSPKTRAERAEAGKSRIAGEYDDKLQAFLDFVLAQYVSQGVEELELDKLAPLISLKYGSATEAATALGGAAAIREAFTGFQRHLYEI